jgi:hypothetical protein
LRDRRLGDRGGRKPDACRLKELPAFHLNRLPAKASSPRRRKTPPLASMAKLIGEIQSPGDGAPLEPNAEKQRGRLSAGPAHRILRPWPAQVRVRVRIMKES